LYVFSKKHASDFDGLIFGLRLHTEFRIFPPAMEANTSPVDVLPSLISRFPQCEFNPRVTECNFSPDDRGGLIFEVRALCCKGPGTVVYRCYGLCTFKPFVYNSAQTVEENAARFVAGMDEFALAALCTEWLLTPRQSHRIMQLIRHFVGELALQEALEKTRAVLRQEADARRTTKDQK
jgi:hypothetical protein